MLKIKIGRTRGGPRASDKKAVLPADRIRLLDDCIALLERGAEIPCDPYPRYPGLVLAALGLLETDPDYMANAERIGDLSASKMSIGQIASMLTFIQRGERFCDGHILTYIENGRLLELLKRLRALAVESEEPESCRKGLSGDG